MDGTGLSAQFTASAAGRRDLLRDLSPCGFHPGVRLAALARGREIWLRANGIDPRQYDAHSRSSAEAYAAIPATDRRAFERGQQRQFLAELDQCHGCCLLEKEPAGETVATALDFFHGQRVWTGDLIVMPNHVHMLVQPFPGVMLEEWLYSVKRFSSAALCKEPSLNARAMMRQGHLWQKESFDRVVRDLAELRRTRRYIARNPARLRPGAFTLRMASWLDEFASPGEGPA